MPNKNNQTCLKCESSESSVWTNAENLGVLCLDCVTETKEEIIKAEEVEDEEKQDGDGRTKKKGRPATRSYKTRLNSLVLPKAPSTKGRRTKSIPIKAPEAIATPTTSESVIYKGAYYQVGDIVSLLDEDGGIYYAQIRGFLTDQYCEKSACITWLLPTKLSCPPEVAFEPSTYIIGPEEEVPRTLDCMEFVMHAPSDYYKCKSTPYPPVHPPAKPGYIWTTLNPVPRAQTGTSRNS